MAHAPNKPLSQQPAEITKDSTFTGLATLGHVDVLVIPIAVVITQEDAARWRERGVFSCIPKPFDLGTYRTALLVAATEICARRAARAT